METFELRYFLGVAALENVHKAGEKLNISPASLSKAIARLEDELGVKLFQREGRNIRLSEEGKILQVRASEIVRLEEATKLELMGSKGQINIIVAGPERILATESSGLCDELRSSIPNATFEFIDVSDEDAIDMITNGEAHLALSTKDMVTDTNIKSKALKESSFQVFVSRNHPLFAKAKKELPIEEILEYEFICPTRPFLGQVKQKQSLDGWRDDKFPRKVSYVASSLKILENLVLEGKGIAYLPEEIGKNLGLQSLNISGCSFSCTQKVKMYSRNPKDLGWLKNLF